MYLEIKTSTNGQYYFLIKSEGNHRTLANSEMYINKSDALHAARLIANHGRAEVFDTTAPS